MILRFFKKRNYNTIVQINFFEGKYRKKVEE